MSAPSWSRVKEVLGAALDLDAAQRSAHLDQACAGDPELRAEVDRLLSAHEQADSLLEPAVYASSASWDALQADEDEAALLVGQRVGRYLITRMIGRGGMGAVYEAEQESPRRRVALKVMRAGGGLVPGSVVRRFQYESQVLAGLRHPGIAQVFDAGVHTAPAQPGSPSRNIPFFAMEYVPDAQTITAFAAAGSLSLRAKLALFIKVCDAAHHGHQRGVIHRDLKPANILISGEPPEGSGSDGLPQPKIIDFGVARVLRPDGAIGSAAAMTMQTGVGQIIGTLQYMSPEQCDQSAQDVDVRSDVYTLGLLLYELVCGKPPYDISGAGFLTAVRVIQAQPPARPSVLIPSLRGDLENILLKSLEKDREHRYQSASDLAADIGRFLHSEPILARPPSAAHQLRLFARRNRPLVAGAAAVLVALVLGMIGTGIGLLRAQAAGRAAHLEAQRATRASDFLMNTLRSADPNLFLPEHRADLDPESRAIIDAEGADAAWGFAGQRGRAAEVAEVLQKAGAELETTFADDPIIQAQLSFLIGTTLVSMNHLEGEPLVKRAVELQRRNLGDDDPATIRSMSRYSDILRIFNKYDEAVELIGAAHAAAIRHYGPNDPLTRAIGRQRTRTMVVTPGHEDEALSLARTAAAQAASAGGPESVAALVEQAEVADLLLIRGKDDEAEPLARRAVDGLSKALGENAFTLCEPVSTLADILRSRGAPPDQVERYLRRSVAIQTRFRGPDHLATLEFSRGLIDYLLFSRKFDEAAQLAGENADSYTRVLGADADLTLKAKARYARTLTLKGTDLPLAERLAREAAEGDLRYTPGGDGWGVYYRAVQAAAIRLQGRSAEAEAILRDVIHILHDPVPNNPDLVRAYIYMQLAACLSDQGHDDQAEQALLTAQAFAPKEEPIYHVIVAEVLESLAAFYDKTGRPEQAAKCRAGLPLWRRSG